MNESADVVIIGSGVAGALCAWRLAQKGLKVLILEAGPRIERKDIVQGFVGAHHLDLSAGFPNERWAPRPDWGTPTDDYIRQTGKTARIEYLRVVGGTTWHWGAHCVRFLPRDFRIRSLYGVGDDWPISYDDIEPFYALADKEFGVCGNDAEDGGSPRSTPFPCRRFRSVWPSAPLRKSSPASATGLPRIRRRAIRAITTADRNVAVTASALRSARSGRNTAPASTSTRRRHSASG
jgi:glucose dehydrogenase